MSALDFSDNLRPITLLQFFARSLCLAELPLMEVSNVWAFLISSGTMYRLGPSISWLLMVVGETEAPAPIRTGVVNLGEVPTVFPSHGIVLSVSFQFNTGGSLKTLAALCAASVTNYFDRTVRTACKVFPLAATGRLVNRRDDNWNDFWDETVDQ